MAEDKKIKEIKKIIAHLEVETEKAKKLLMALSEEKNEIKSDDYDSIIESDDDNQDFEALFKEKDLEKTKDGDEVIIEGVFNGQQMIGADGKQYSVPANYASKSKLIEGDILKLKIDRFGNFVFKQIGPTERVRKIGVVVDDAGELAVISENKKYRVIKASLTYFKAEEGDEAVIIVPKDIGSQWAAVENIIKKETVMNLNK
jgi:hypothetical protein